MRFLKRLSYCLPFLLLPFSAYAQAQEKDEPEDRVHRILIRCSGLTLYFFMFQHVVIYWISSLAAPQIDASFGMFDYWGLAALVVCVTAMLAALTQKLEMGIRAFFA